MTMPPKDTKSNTIASTPREAAEVSERDLKPGERRRSGQDVQDEPQ